MKKVIILNGCGGSGKDTFVKCCKEVSSKTIYKFSIIDWVKEQAKLLGWNGGKSNKDRKFLSDLNDALAAWGDYPYTMAIEEIKACFDEERWDGGVELVFIDVREPEVISRLRKEIQKNMGIEAITVLVDRGIKESYGNHADDEVYNYLYNYVIDNTSTLNDLAAAAATFMEEIEKNG